VSVERLADRYVLSNLLGRGAMGAVYEARDERLGRTVAVKLLVDNPSAAGHEQLQAACRLRDEAKAAARVHHPSLVALLDSGDDERMGPFIVFEYLPGGSLAAELGDEGLLSWPDVIERVATPLLEALDTLHRQGVLHRDIKPENMVQGADGRYRVGDLGLATFEGRMAHTKTGFVVGTMGYLAPERVLTPETPPTPAADLFSAALVIVRAATGRMPYRAQQGGSLLQAQLDEDVDATVLEEAGIPAHPALALTRCLDRDPARRLPSAASLLQALTSYEVAATAEVGSAARSEPAPPPRQPKAAPRASRSLARVSGPVMAVACCVVLLVVHQIRTGNVVPPSPPPRRHQLDRATSEALEQKPLDAEKVRERLDHELDAITETSGGERSVPTGPWLALRNALGGNPFVQSMATALREERVGHGQQALRIWTELAEGSPPSPQALLVAVQQQLRLASVDPTTQPLSILDEALFRLASAMFTDDRDEERRPVIATLATERARRALLQPSSPLATDQLWILARLGPLLFGAPPVDASVREAHGRLLETLRGSPLADTDEGRTVLKTPLGMAVPNLGQFCDRMAGIVEARRSRTTDPYEIGGYGGVEMASVIADGQTAIRMEHSRAFWVRFFIYCLERPPAIQRPDELSRVTMWLTVVLSNPLFQGASNSSGEWDPALTCRRTAAVVGFCLRTAVRTISSRPYPEGSLRVVNHGRAIFSRAADMDPEKTEPFYDVVADAITALPAEDPARLILDALVQDAHGSDTAALPLLRRAFDTVVGTCGPLTGHGTDRAAYHCHLLSEVGRGYWQKLFADENYEEALGTLERVYDILHPTPANLENQMAYFELLCRVVLLHASVRLRMGLVITPDLRNEVEMVRDRTNQDDLRAAAEQLLAGVATSYVW